MLTVISYFWQLALLRANPSQVPTATWFVALVIAANLVVSIALSTVLSDGTAPLRIATAILVQQAALAGLLWTGLYLRELSSRFVPTFTAWLGCDLVITAVFGLLLPALQQLTGAQPTPGMLVFFFWSMAAAGNILRHAFNVGMPLGVAIALGLTMFATVISQTAINA